jgi:dolichol-phosphate mannosyltransferase
MQVVELSIVIPTFNERGCIEPLVLELDRALADVHWEALFVDDSTDGTDTKLAEISRRDRRIRVLHREVNRGGLAGAVVDGLALVDGTYICVLDADLQHPPQRIKDLLATVRYSEADIVVASRYMPGGSTGGLDGPLRRFFSRGLKTVAKAAFPKRLAGITDPLGGYFIVRRSVVQGASLQPIGYKILLEMLVRCPWQTACEVPYEFEQRRYGESKADLRQGLQFLEHLTKLVWECSPMFTLPRVLTAPHPRHATDTSAGAFDNNSANCERSSGVSTFIPRHSVEPYSPRY